MKKIIAAVAILMITAVFEQKASVNFKKHFSSPKPTSNTIQVIDQLDSLTRKFETYNKNKRYEN